MKTTATGTVLPPGTLSAAVPPLSGNVTVTIRAVDPENGYDADDKPNPSEHLEATCEYPGGWTKGHQVKGVEDLLPKVIGQLRGRYGASEVKILKAPKALKAGAAIEVEV